MDRFATTFCQSKKEMARVDHPRCSASCCPPGVGGWVFMGPPKPSTISRIELETAEILWSFETDNFEKFSQQGPWKLSVGEAQLATKKLHAAIPTGNPVWPILVNGILTDVLVNVETPSMRLLKLGNVLLLLHVPSSECFELVPVLEHGDVSSGESREDVACIGTITTSYRSRKLAS